MISSTGSLPIVDKKSLSWSRYLAPNCYTWTFCSSKHSHKKATALTVLEISQKIVMVEFIFIIFEIQEKHTLLRIDSTGGNFLKISCEIFSVTGMLLHYLYTVKMQIFFKSFTKRTLNLQILFARSCWHETCFIFLGLSSIYH